MRHHVEVAAHVERRNVARRPFAPDEGEARVRKSVVERAIDVVGGSSAEFARRLSEYAGVEITRQRVHGWQLRGVFPRDMLVHVERLTGISIAELAMAKVKDTRDAGNIVARAIRLMGADTTPAQFALELRRISGRKVTRQMVNGWQAREQFPLEITPYVHMLTRIPVKELVAVSSRRRRTRQ